MLVPQNPQAALDQNQWKRFLIHSTAWFWTSEASGTDGPHDSVQMGSDGSICGSAATGFSPVGTDKNVGRVLQLLTWTVEAQAPPPKHLMVLSPPSSSSSSSR